MDSAAGHYTREESVASRKKCGTATGISTLTPLCFSFLSRFLHGMDCEDEAEGQRFSDRHPKLRVLPIDGSLGVPSFVIEIAVSRIDDNGTYLYFVEIDKLSKWYNLRGGLPSSLFLEKASREGEYYTLDTKFLRGLSTIEEEEKSNSNETPKPREFIRPYLYMAEFDPDHSELDISFDHIWDIVFARLDCLLNIAQLSDEIAKNSNGDASMLERHESVSFSEIQTTYEDRLKTSIPTNWTSADSLRLIDKAAYIASLMYVVLQIVLKDPTSNVREWAIEQEVRWLMLKLKWSHPTEEDVNILINGFMSGSPAKLRSYHIDIGNIPNECVNLFRLFNPNLPDPSSWWCIPIFEFDPHIYQSCKIHISHGHAYVCYQELKSNFFPYLFRKWLGEFLFDNTSTMNAAMEIHKNYNDLSRLVQGFLGRFKKFSKGGTNESIRTAAFLPDIEDLVSSKSSHLPLCQRLIMFKLTKPPNHIHHWDRWNYSDFYLDLGYSRDHVMNHFRKHFAIAQKDLHAFMKDQGIDLKREKDINQRRSNNKSMGLNCFVYQSQRYISNIPGQNTKGCPYASMSSSEIVDFLPANSEEILNAMDRKNYSLACTLEFTMNHGRTERRHRSPPQYTAMAFHAHQDQ